MNSKKRDFIISISILFIFCMLIILYLNYLFIAKFDLNQEKLIYLVIFLLIVGLAIFLSFSNSILKALFKSDEKLEKNIRQTIHELNVPVSTINMNVQLLEKSLSDEKSLARLQRIKKASDNLFKLYENMEYEIKKEIERIEKQEFFLEDIIKTSLEKFEDIKKDTKIDLSLENIELNSDYNGFLKTLDNLISNAIKYNSKVQPLIKIEFNKPILSIFNRGEKIDTKNLFIVFDKYFQENPSNDGFGLGLAIVKEFCDQNKISINIESCEDGTKFNLNIKNIIKIN